MQDSPLRLAVGSHRAGSGRGCAMNVISWENGDTQITDLPSCSDPFLARVVQSVNDHHCTHLTGDLLCPPCSVEVLALAHRTTGTALDWPADDLRRPYVRLALAEARSVEHLSAAGKACNDVTGRWLTGEATADEVREARAAAYRAAYAAAYAATATADAAYAAAYAATATTADAADAAAYAATATAADAAAYAAYAAYAADADATATAAYAAYAAYAADADAPPRLQRLQRAHRIIDRFEELTGVRAEPVPAEVTARAVEAMTR
jgi:hypothetical protein